jgi:hypothetical protein
VDLVALVSSALQNASSSTGGETNTILRDVWQDGILNQGASAPSSCNSCLVAFGFLDLISAKISVISTQKLPSFSSASPEKSCDSNLNDLFTACFYMILQITILKFRGRHCLTVYSGEILVK